MATKKSKKVVTKTIDFTNSIEKIKGTAKTVNTEVVDTTIEVLEDLKTNGERIRTAATTKVKEAIENLTIDNSLKFVKNTAKNIHNYNIETAEEAIDLAMKGGKEWQVFLAKSLKNGVQFLGDQQDITLTALERLQKQYDKSNLKFSNFLNFDFNIQLSNEDIALETPTFKTTKKTVKKVAEKANTTAKIAKKTVKSVAKKATTTKKAATSTKPVAKKITKKANPTVKTTRKAAKPVTKKTVAITKNNLRLIEGIGPKIEELLNKGGIQTFQHLADASQKNLKEILAAAGPRYKMHDPTTWNKQAALAAAGKKAALTKLQGELKGGRAKK